MKPEDFCGMPKGHPLTVDSGSGYRDEVFFRSARFCPQLGALLVCVADRGGGIVAVAAGELSFVEDEDRSESPKTLPEIPVPMSVLVQS